MENTSLTEKLAVIKSDTGGMLEVVKSLKIKTAEDMVGATDILTQIVGRKKRVEELRQFFVKPLNDQVKAINEEFKKVSVPLVSMEGEVKTKIVDYRKIEANKLEEARKKEEARKHRAWLVEQEKLRKQREKEAEAEKKRLAKLELSKKDEKIELKRIDDEKKAKEDEAGRQEFGIDDDDFKQTKTVHSSSGSVKVRTQWNFKIVDESKVPKRFWVIDEKMIRRAVKEGERKVPGIDIFEEEIVGVNT